MMVVENYNSEEISDITLRSDHAEITDQIHVRETKKYIAMFSRIGTLTLVVLQHHRGFDIVLKCILLPISKRICEK